MNLDLLTHAAIGLKLYRFQGERLIACEDVIFTEGYNAVNTTLRRAAISGRVEVEGEIKNHFADVLIDANGSWDQTIALDAGSYRALKNRWMRCKVESEDRVLKKRAA